MGSLGDGGDSNALILPAKRVKKRKGKNQVRAVAQCYFFCVQFACFCFCTFCVIRVLFVSGAWKSWIE